MCPGPISSNSTANINSNQLNQTGAVNLKELGAGQGLNGTTGPVPDAPKGDTTRAMASLTFFMSSGKGVDTEVTLVQVAVEMRDVEAGTQKERITGDQEKQRLQASEKKEKLEEAQKKMDEAKEKQKSASLLDKIKLAFEWIGAAIAVIAAVVLIATGAGAVAGAFLLAAAVTAVIMAIDSTVATFSENGLGIAGNIQYAIDKDINGLSDEDAKSNAKKADMGFKIALAVIGVVCSLGGGFASAGTSAFNAGKAAADAGKTIGQIASAAKSAFWEALKSGGPAMMRFIQYTQAGVTAVNEAGKGATNIAKSKLTYDATELKSGAQKLQGESKVDESNLKRLEDAIDAALTRLMAAGNRFAAMLEDIMSSLQDRGNSLANARFGI